MVQRVARRSSASFKRPILLPTKMARRVTPEPPSLAKLKSEPAGTRELLLSLAVKNSEHLLQLWSHDPVELPATSGATVVSVQPKRVSRPNRIQSPPQKKDSVTIHSAAPVSTQPVPVLPRVHAQAPQLTTQNVPKPPVLVEPPPVAQLARRESPPEQPEIQAPVQTSKEQSSADAGRLTRLTREASGEAWLLSALPGAPSVLMAQTNSALPRWLKESQLNTHPGPGRYPNTEGPTIQTGQGWISGWIPADSVVRIKGADRLSYFREDGSEVQPESPGEKFFVASRVPVGAAVVQLLRRSDDTVVSAAGAPVLAQTATQIDFRTLRTARIRGSLWDSESAVASGVAHAEVRLVGFPNHLAISNQDGSFDLGEVQVAEGLGAFIEARLPGGFTHRYSISSKGTQKPLALFHFSDQRIHRWLEGLDGGVSPESGLVIASVLAEKAKSGRPVVRPLGLSTKASAETYWLDAQDHLVAPHVAPTSDSAFVQWVGVEVVGRSVLAGLQSPRGRWIEAKWLPVSPGVVSVFSPEE